MTLAWLWLDCAIAAQAPAHGHDEPTRQHRRGMLQAMQYFFAYELPKIDAWLTVVARRDDTCRAMQEDWF